MRKSLISLTKALPRQGNARAMMMLEQAMPDGLGQPIAAHPESRGRPPGYPRTRGRAGYDPLPTKFAISQTIVNFLETFADIAHNIVDNVDNSSAYSSRCGGVDGHAQGEDASFLCGGSCAAGDEPKGRGPERPAIAGIKPGPQQPIPTYTPRPTLGVILPRCHHLPRWGLCVLRRSCNRCSR